MHQIQNQHKRGDKIKINKDSLKKVTNILLKNINSELKKGYKLNQKVALFYLKINNKKYYYSYNFPEDSIKELYNSYTLVDIKRAKTLLLNQINN